MQPANDNKREECEVLADLFEVEVEKLRLRNALVSYGWDI